MKKRKNIIISAITCMMSICLMMFGVYASTNPSVSISGQVSYSARDAKVLVLGKVNGQAGEDQENKVAYPAVADTTNPQESEKVVNASQYMGFTKGTSANDDTDNLAPWTMNTTHAFYEDATGIRPIVISFKMTNLSNYPVVATVDFTGVTDANLASKNLTRTTTGLEENKVYLNKNVTKEITISYAVANDSASVNGDNLLNMSITFEKTIIPPTPVEGEIEINNNGKNQTVNQSDWEYTFDGKNFALTKFVGEFPAKVNGESTLIVPSQVKCDDGKYYDVKAIGDATEEQVQAVLNGEADFEQTLVAAMVIVDITKATEDYMDSIPTNIVIPEGIEIISPGALVYAMGVTQLPSTIKEIGSVSCAGTGITTLNLPNLTRIGLMAFNLEGDLCAPLTSVTIPSGVTEIGMVAFSGCSTLTSVTFAENSQLTEIGMNAFYKTGLTSVNIPKSVTNIGEGAFADCSTLTTVNISQNDPTKQQCGEFIFGKLANVNENLKIYVPVRLYKEAKNWSTYKDFMIAPTVDTVSEETVGDWKIQINSDDTANIIGYIGDTTKEEITIPSTITYKGKAYKVYAVGDTNNYETIEEAQEANMIFYNDTIISVIFGEGNLLPVKKLIVEDGIYVIGNYALGCLTSLEELVLPNTLMTIERGAFIGNPFTSITIPSGVSNIGDNAFATFAGGGLMNDNNLSNNGYYIGTSENPHLVLLGIKDKTVSNFQIDSETKFIQNEVFKECTSLTSVSIPSAVTSIGTSAFEGCTALKNVSFTSNGNLMNIEKSAFSGCSALQSVSLPNGVKSIGEEAFNQCSKLTSISIPSGLRSLGKSAFADCDGLKKTSYLHDKAYYLGNSTNPYVVLFSLTDTSITSFQINEKTKFIYGGVFYNCSNLTSVNIPSGLRGIGGSAFYSKTIRVDITDMNSWLNIDFSDDYSNPLFMGANSGEVSLYLNGTLVTEVSIPSSFTKVKDRVFAGYKKLTSVTIPDTVASIGDSAFYRCSMTSIVIPNRVTSIGKHAFSGCELLTSIAIPSSVSSIGIEAFRGCSGLTRVDITDMDSWLNIDFDSSFYTNPLYCAHNLYLNGELVTEVTIPSGSDIKDNAFAGCTSLTSIVLPETTTRIGRTAFWDCTNLTSITILATTPPTLGGQTFENCTKAVIYVPASSVETYKTANLWTDYADKIQAIAG